MRILLIGSGAREHALARSLAADPATSALTVAPGNPGIAALADTADVQARYAVGEKQAAAAAIPTELVTDVALVGTPSDLAGQLARWQDSCVTTLILQTDPQMLAPLVTALRG